MCVEILEFLNFLPLQRPRAQIIQRCFNQLVQLLIKRLRQLL